MIQTKLRHYGFKKLLSNTLISNFRIRKTEGINLLDFLDDSQGKYIFKAWRNPNKRLTEWVK